MTPHFGAEKQLSSDCHSIPPNSFIFNISYFVVPRSRTWQRAGKLRGVLSGERVVAPFASLPPAQRLTRGHKVRGVGSPQCPEGSTAVLWRGGRQRSVRRAALLYFAVVEGEALSPYFGALEEEALSPSLRRRRQQPSEGETEGGVVVAERVPLNEAPPGPFVERGSVAGSSVERESASRCAAR